MPPKSKILLNSEGAEDEDGLEFLNKKTLDEQEQSAALALRMEKRVYETSSLLQSQGEQLNSIGNKLDNLDAKIKVEKAKVKYLKALSGNFMIPVLTKKPESEVKLFFANEAPKDANGRPIAQKRTSSLDPTESQSTYYQSKNLESRLDASASDIDHQRSKEAEEQIDKSMFGIRKGVSNLKQAAINMGQELESQNQTMDSLNAKADKAQTGIQSLNKGLNKIMNK
ncbi:hypothetical protein HDV02_003942 [Globomyces sp. JEL0801]|nr:hypothetical protein HDV02_003942 [Globomyces sp. JEL0801]